MLRAVIWGSPSDPEKQALSLGPGTAGRVGVNFAVQQLVHSKDVVARDVVAGSGNELMGKRSVRELGRVVVVPGEQAGDVEDRMDGGHGRWQG